MTTKHTSNRGSWPRRPLREIIQIANGQVDPKQPPYSTMLHVGPDNIPTGGGRLIGNLITAKELELISGKYEFTANSILYTKIRPNLNKVAVPGFAGICSADIYPIQPKDGSVDRDFLYHLLRSSIVLKPAIATSGRTGLPKINRPDLEAIDVPIPPLPIQRQISRVLETWDRALDVLGQQIERKNSVLSFLRESVVQGRHRLGKLNGEPWPIVKLGDVTVQLTERNGQRYGRNRVMGVNKFDGLVPMKAHVIADDIARYLILPHNSFAYNPMRLNIGSIVMSEMHEEVIVSPDYVVFACRPHRCTPRFLNHLRRSRAWQNFMVIAGSGGVRVRIYYEDLADFEFHLPSPSEQVRITEVLDDAQREVTILHEELKAREKQRDALASELLTGQLCVADARVPEREGR